MRLNSSKQSWRTYKMLDVNLGDKVQTNDGHIGIVVKKYHVTGIVGIYVHIQ